MEDNNENGGFEPSLRCKAWATLATAGGIVTAFAFVAAPAVVPVTAVVTAAAGVTALRARIKEEIQFNRNQNRGLE